MLGHGCGVSQYIQFHDRIKDIYQILPPQYVRSYLGEKSNQFLHEQWIIALSKSVELFVMVSISDMPTIKSWTFLGSMMDTAIEKIP